MYIWQELIFRPLVNLLIGIYNTIGLENLGLTIVWLTIIIRLVMIPFSYKRKSRRAKEISLSEQLKELQKTFASNPSVLREEQRNLLRKYNFSHWQQVMVLAVQGLVLYVLYVVFINGANIASVVEVLYRNVHAPERINTMFLGIDIIQHNFFLSALAGIILFANIWHEHWQTHRLWTRKEMLYAFGLPLATFAVLYMLPAVKAVFIITSLLFTDALLLILTVRDTIKSQDMQIAKVREEDKIKYESTIPRAKERFQ